ncbi:hypothetical protein GGX14DRAFT_635176 [Mycena pura]|uniref:Uncharacterized protein n=1 Tax=Mycena pura TaxID=153505 RepID=A0AAD6Y9R0_9AGAR|nr:hypothetical protein GGX14DRAFT_635176 [Mycena pura]
MGRVITRDDSVTRPKLQPKRRAAQVASAPPPLLAHTSSAVIRRSGLLMRRHRIKRATAFHYELNDDERTWRGLIEVISYLHPDASGHAHRLQALNISLATFSEHSAHLRWLLHPQKSSYPPRITPCHAPMSTPYHTATPRHMPHALLQADSTQSSTSDAASGFTMHRCTLLASPAPMARMFAAAVRSAAPARAIVFATMQAELRLMAPSGSARAVYHYKPRLRF